MNDDLTPMFNTGARIQLWRDAIASVAMSHPQACECSICQAAAGNEAALAHAISVLSDQEDA